MKYFVLLITLLIWGCGSEEKRQSTIMPTEPVITDDSLWNGITLNYGFIETDMGEVPFFYYKPDSILNKRLIVGFHQQHVSGYPASKESWKAELSDMLNYAIESNTAFLAPELYGHGEWVVDGFHPEEISEETLESFMVPSTEGVSALIKSFCHYNEQSIDSLIYVGVSLGCFTATDISAKGIKPIAMAFVVPDPLKEMDSTYSFHKNLNAYKDVALVTVTGTEDEYNEPGEVQWWMDQIDSEKKYFIEYEGGHIPPMWALDSCSAFLNRIVEYASHD